MVAGVGAGYFADFTAASVAVRLAPAAIDPDPQATKIYADAYRRYLAAFDAVESALATQPVLSARPTSAVSARPVVSTQPAVSARPTT
jgi:xylulokinase